MAKGICVMLKRICLIVLTIIMLLSPIDICASEAIDETVASLALQAQRFYNTNIAYADMYVTKVDDTKYEVTHMTQGGKTIKTQLYQTEWGTWNLGNMSYSDGMTEKVVIGGATDWEYVFRVLNPINQNLEFTGGNHGSEVFRSMGMYDSVTGESFVLSVGESKYVNRLVIEEHTTLKLGNVDYLNYADVKRVYTFVGDTVNLDCEITFLRDVKMALSYSTMACVNKDFSRYCFFDNGAYVTTEPKGAASKKYLGNVKATSCHLSGDDPTVKVTVGIYNPKDMTDNFSNRDKVFLWDMTEEFNKLYFSMFDMSNLKKVTAGTVWDFGSFWKIETD